MRQRSETWKRLAEAGEFDMKTVAVINGKEYSEITAPVIQQKLFASDKLSVGNCVAASLTFTVRTTDAIPKSAKVVIKSCLTDGTTDSEWMEFGTFWVSQRSVDDDLIDLECYDAMLKGNQPYGGSDEALNWPKPMTTVVNTIKDRLGVVLDDRTVIKTGEAYVCQYPGDMTLLEVLGYIGACHGGNWIITPENKLRLVPLISPPTETFYIVDQGGNRILTMDGHRLVWDHGGSDEATQDEDPTNVPVVLSSMTTGQPFTVSRVTMAIDEEHVYSAGDDTGYELEISPNPYSAQAIADDLLEMLGGLSYVPFSIVDACYDPAAELGDQLVAGDIRSVLCGETRSYDIGFRADAEAPGKDELEDEYPYPSAIARLQHSTLELQKDNVKIRSEIKQTQDSIQTKVSAGDVESIMVQKADLIRLKAEKIAWESNQSTMYENGVLAIQGAVIKGTMSAVKKVSSANNGMLFSQGKIVGLYHGSNVFNIVMPYDDEFEPISGYIIDGEYDEYGNPVMVSDTIEASVPEMPEFDLHDHVENPSGESVSINTCGSSYGLDIGAGGKIAISIMANGKMWLCPENGLYVDNYKTMRDGSFTVGGRTYHIVNGLIVVD